jgi:hypothetical protein
MVSTGCAMMPKGSDAAMPMRESPKSMPRAGWGLECEVFSVK